MKRGPGRPRKDANVQSIFDTFLIKTEKKKENVWETEPNTINTYSKNNEIKVLDDFQEDEVRIWAWNINGIRPAISKNYLLKFIQDSKWAYWFYRKTNYTLIEWSQNWWTYTFEIVEYKT